MFCLHVELINQLDIEFGMIVGGLSVFLKEKLTFEDEFFVRQFVTSIA